MKNKIIWLTWLQGLASAPPLVQQCVASWRRENPGWKTIVLDEQCFGDYVDPVPIIKGNEPFITRQALSDIIRINLLNTHGGVWADATCFCCRPLDDWLDEYMGSGFFAFRDPGVDRPISSWFLAAATDSQLASSFCEQVNAFWSARIYSNQHTAVGKMVDLFIHGPLKRASHGSARFRLLFDTMTRWKVYPYYWFHYLFARMIGGSGPMREAWLSTPVYSADIPHGLQHHGLFQPISATLKREIDERTVPLYKLLWDYNRAACPETCTLEYLLGGRSGDGAGRV